MLRPREGALDRVRLLVDDDRPCLEVDAVPAQRVKLATSHPLVDADVEVGGEARRRQPVRERHEAGDLDLRRRLRVASSSARTEAELREGVADDETARGALIASLKQARSAGTVPTWRPPLSHAAQRLPIPT